MKLIHTDTINWKGLLHKRELYESRDISGLGPITQVQAILFLNNEKIVIYKHIDGYYGLPGGTIENNESFEKTLKREVMEESSCKVIDFGLIGYEKDTETESGAVKYQLRYWALVELTDNEINDPDRKSMSREVVDIKDANGKLNWGKRGEILLDLACREFKG